MKSSHPTKHPYLKYLCLGSILLFSFLQGLMNVYIGGTEALLQSMFHLRAPAFTELTATLMFSNGVGCIVFGTLIDRYGAGVISSICGVITTIGILLFTISHRFYDFAGSEWVIGFGVSVWYPAGMVVCKLHFDEKQLPFLAGVLIFSSYLGSACISVVIYLSNTYGLIDTDLTVLCVAVVATWLLFITAKYNGPIDTPHIQPTLKEDYRNQIRVMNNWIVAPMITAQTIASVFSYVFLPLLCIPYLVMLVSPTQAAIITSTCLIIYGVSGVILGKIYYRIFSPLGWMVFQLSISLFLCTLLFQLPNTMLSFGVIAALLFTSATLLGGNAAYTATYLANLFETKYTGTISGVYAWLFQFIISAITPLFGLALSYANPAGNYRLEDYEFTFQLMLGAFAISTLILIILHRVVKHYPTVIKINATK